MKKAYIVILIAVMLLMALGSFSSCTVDTANCLHERHNPETCKCVACGKKQEHVFKDGVCSGCGKTTPFLWDCIKKDAELFEQVKTGETSQKGSVEELKYTAHAYNLEAISGVEQIIEKTAYVYLPYGYSTANKYDVLILLHGSQEGEGFWFAKGPYDKDSTNVFVGTGNYTVELLDYMIAKELCKPTIVVTPSFYDNVSGRDDIEHYTAENNVAAPLFGNNLLNALLPMVVETYSTYAASSSLTDISNARDHFAYSGFSYGGMISVSSIMSYCLPYFAYIGSFSGLTSNADEVIATLNSQLTQYPIKYWYCSCGTEDRGYDNIRKVYKAITAGVSGLTDDINCSNIDVYGGNHTYEVWLTCLYNSMQVFFK